ncbi:hypothetical protein EPK99_15575 [Neorhizobium lilium]|uniref:Uncharacterized protein n=1 Tax=Neorhizobium lilium TaxID=2503024 RepID=A0A3S3TXC8_9HYPH|nr:hypothetical protein [Neorhizobium lilium]RWX77075.1 hypothetical protein EPK99_15575 [Neorhizobium lilium]
MDDPSAQLSEIAQQLAALAAAAKQLSEQPLFEPDLPANENDPAPPEGTNDLVEAPFSSGNPNR